MAYGDDVMKAIRGTVLDGRPRIGGVGDAEASARARRAAALSAAADYARSGRGGQGDSDMHLERAAEEALSQAMFAGLMTYGRSALALGRRTLADQLARRRASPAAVLRRTRYQGGTFGEGVETLSDTALNPSTLTGARPTGRLGEVATVSKEYSRAYPGIERDVVVNVVPDNEWAGYVEAAKRARAEWAKTSDTSRGFFDRRLSAVSLRAQMPGETMEAYFDRADRTLVHELQHYAQMRDGLPATSPGSGYEWYRTAAREVDARNSANRLVLTPQERAEIPRSMTQDVKPEDVHMDDKGGKSGGFRGWKAYRDAKEAAEAEAAAVAVVNAGITNAPPLSAADLADSRASAEWLKSHERKGLVAEGTLPHTGRPRFYSGNGFMEGDTSFQGDRFSSVVPVDFDAYHGDAEAYKKTGRWAVIPTVYPDADGVTRLHTSDAAESEYRRSGSHFGIFEGLENAESGAQWDHHRGNAEWAERETRQAAKGGDNFGTFRNFLAKDDVPESIFGYLVVQDESQYTEKDLEFFRKNPKAAGFYDLGDDGEMEEDVPQQATGAGIPMLASIFGPAGLDNLRKANWKNLPELATYKEHGHEIQIGELKDVRLRRGWEQALLRKEKKLSDLLDFSSPQGRRLITAYPGIQDIPVTNDDLGAEEAAHGSYAPPRVGEEIWLNPRSVGTKSNRPLEKQYTTILHEGINHAIYLREPSFQGPNVATHDLATSKLTPLGYAMNLNEVLASLASRRGAERAKTGKGAANSAQLAKEIFPEVVRRVNDLTEAELEESQGKMLVEDIVPARAAEPEEDTDSLPEEPVPDHLNAKGGDSVSKEYAEAAKKPRKGAVD